MKLLCATFALLFSTLVSAEPIAPNEELRQIVAADQQDRTAPLGSIDNAKLAPRDAERRAKVKAILARGEIRAAEDFFNAALVFQHGETVEDSRLAFALVTVASTLSPERPGPRAAACSAWDRLLLRSGKPQWYGTQFEPSESTGKIVLSKIDEAAVTDNDRRSCGLPTLRESKANAAQFK
jgi:hypothetical protein